MAQEDHVFAAKASPGASRHESCSFARHHARFSQQAFLGHSGRYGLRVDRHPVAGSGLSAAAYRRTGRCRTFRSLSDRRRRLRHGLAVGAIGSRRSSAGLMLAAGLFEVLQIDIPGRSPGLSGFLSSSLGAWAGIVAGRSLPHDCAPNRLGRLRLSEFIAAGNHSPRAGRFSPSSKHWRLDNGHPYRSAHRRTYSRRNCRASRSSRRRAISAIAIVPPPAYRGGPVNDLDPDRRPGAGRDRLRLHGHGQGLRPAAARAADERDVEPAPPPPADPARADRSVGSRENQKAAPDDRSSAALSPQDTHAGETIPPNTWRWPPAYLEADDP